MTGGGSVAKDFDTRPMAMGNVEFGNIWFVVRRHIWSVLVLVALTVGATYLYLTTVEPSYKAQATMVLTPSETRISQTSAQLETVQINRSFVETELDVIRSRSLASKLAAHLNLFNDTDFLPRSPGSVQTEDERREAVIDRLMSSYNIFRQGESLAIDVVGTANSATLAANIANGVITVYVDESSRNQRDAIDTSMTALERNITRQGELLSQKEIELAELIRGDNLDDPEINERLRSEIERLKSLIAVAERQNVDAERLRQNESSLAEAESELADRTRLELVLKRSEREIELERLRYESMIDRLNDLQVQGESVGNQTRHVTVAQVPRSASWPNTRFALAAAAVAGAIIGLLLALIREGLDKRVHSDTQILQAARLQSLGFIPRLARGLLRGRTNPVSMLIKHPDSHFAESIRGVLTLWSIGRRKRVLMVASGLPSEGKTSVAVSLAVGAALDGSRALLIDLDIHRHGASKLLNCEAQDGSLMDAIKDKATIQTPTHDGKTIENLDVLTFKKRTKVSQSEYNRMLKDYLFTISETYDIVIIDTPPALLTNDACRHAELVEEAILVVRWGQTKSTTLADTRERLAHAGIDVIAAVLNDVDFERHRKYGYGGYAGAYSRGYSYAKQS